MFNRPAMQQQPPAPPAPPAAQYQPPAPPAPPAAPAQPVAEQQFWVAVNGTQPQVMTASQARSLPPTTSAMRMDQVGGWVTLAALLPAAAPQQHQQPPQQQQMQFQRPQQPQQQQPPQQPQGYASGSGAAPSLFAGHDIDKAEVYRKGLPITAGEYIIKIMNTEAIKGRQANFMCVEAEVVVSNWDQGIPATHGARMVGANVSVLIKENDSFASNMKEIILALSGFDGQGQPRNPDGGGFNEDLHQMKTSNPFGGVLAYVTAVDGFTRQNKPWTRINWYPVPLQADGSPDMIKLHQSR